MLVVWEGRTRLFFSERGIAECCATDCPHVTLWKCHGWWLSREITLTRVPFLDVGHLKVGPGCAGGEGTAEHDGRHVFGAADTVVDLEAEIEEFCF